MAYQLQLWRRRGSQSRGSGSTSDRRRGGKRPRCQEVSQIALILLVLGRVFVVAALVAPSSTTPWDTC
jgi:hypothetical protein